MPFLVSLVTQGSIACTLHYIDRLKVRSYTWDGGRLKTNTTLLETYPFNYGINTECVRLF